MLLGDCNLEDVYLMEFEAGPLPKDKIETAYGAIRRHWDADPFTQYRGDGRDIGDAEGTVILRSCGLDFTDGTKTEQAFAETVAREIRESVGWECPTRIRQTRVSGLRTSIWRDGKQAGGDMGRLNRLSVGHCHLILYHVAHLDTDRINYAVTDLGRFYSCECRCEGDGSEWPDMALEGWEVRPMVCKPAEYALSMTNFFKRRLGNDIEVRIEMVDIERVVSSEWKNGMIVRCVELGTVMASW